MKRPIRRLFRCLIVQHDKKSAPPQTRIAVVVIRAISKAMHVSRPFSPPLFLAELFVNMESPSMPMYDEYA